jgi:hypothetical protein
MSAQLSLTKIKLGTSGTTSNNFIISVPDTADGTLTISRESDGRVAAKCNADGSVTLPGVPAFSAGTSTVTNVASGSATQIVYATEDFDTHNAFNTPTFTVPIAGYYWFTGACYVGAPIAINSTITMAIYKNGVKWVSNNHSNGVAAYDISTISGLVLCAVNDTIDIRMIQNTGSTVNTSADASVKFQGYLVRGI